MGKDPLTRDVFGWMTGGKDQASTVQMFGGPSEGDLRSGLNKAYGNLGNAQDIMNALVGMTGEQYALTGPARRAVTERASDLLSGNFNPTSSPAYSPMRRAVESNYSGAKENILANLPMGGVQEDALAGLEENRASSLSDIMSQILTQELQNAWGVGTNAYPQAISGMSSALQGGSVPGQMMGSILQYLVQRLTGSAANQEAVNIF